MKLKKMLALLLALMLAFALVACGDSADEGGDVPDEPKQTENNGAGAGTPLETMTFVKVPENIVGSEWSFCGGFVNGVEMDNEKATATLKQYGGVLQLNFLDEANVEFVQGGGVLAGTCGADEDNDMVVITVQNGDQTIEYTCLFAELNGDTILVQLSGDSTDNAFYFRSNVG